MVLAVLLTVGYRKRAASPEAPRCLSLARVRKDSFNPERGHWQELIHNAQVCQAKRPDVGYGLIRS